MTAGYEGSYRGIGGGEGLIDRMDGGSEVTERE